MDEKQPEKSAPPADSTAADRDDFPICDFPDLRRLRHCYIKKGAKPIGVDSSDNPRPDDDEEDFGLTRSTSEEALDFLKKALEPDCGDDPMTEFLDDE